MSELRSRYDVVVSQTAEDDLMSAAKYIAYELGDKSAASNLIDKFDALVKRLETLPSAYPYVREEIAASSGYQWAYVGNYLALFQTFELSKTVLIVRFVYKKSDYARFIC